MFNIDSVDLIYLGNDSIISSISFIIIAILIGYNNIIYFFVVFIGCLFSYLVYNNFINRVFLGDSGSLFLGWIFSIMSLLFMKYSSSITLHIPLLIFALPAFDVIYVMLFRFIKTKDSQFLIRLRNMFVPDHSHIHHALQKVGF